MPRYPKTLGGVKTYRDYIEESAKRGDQVALDTLQRWKTPRKDSFVVERVYWGKPPKQL